MKLVLAEKPSVAQSIAKVLGVTKRQDGYLEGNGYRKRKRQGCESCRFCLTFTAPHTCLPCPDRKQDVKS